MSMTDPAPATTTSEIATSPDPWHTWTLFGHEFADRGALSAARWLSRISPLFPNAIEDATYLRVSLGNAWLLSPVMGVALGLLGTLSTEGFAVPPTTWVYLAIMALGILDASAGLIAFLIFAVGSLLSGHLLTLHAVATVLVLGFLWFGGAEVIHRIRPLTIATPGMRPVDRWWRTLGDFVILPALVGFVFGALNSMMPFFTGLEVPVASEKHLIQVAAASAMLVRALGESLVRHHYRHRLAAVRIPEPRHRSATESFIAWLIKVAAGYALLWTLLGVRWQTFVTLGLFLMFEPVLALGQRFPKSNVIYRVLPRRLSKILMMALVGQMVYIVLASQVKDPRQMVGWALVSLAAVAILVLILGQFEGEDLPATWVTRLVGAMIVLIFIGVTLEYVRLA